MRDQKKRQQDPFRVDTVRTLCYTVCMQRTCNKCNRTLDLDTDFNKNKSNPQGRERTCRDCVQTRAREKYKLNPAPSVAQSRTSRPCRECHRSLTVEHYHLPNSWYCKHCTSVRKERARLAQPDSQCDTCGAVKSQQYMLKTRSRCTQCESQRRATAKRQQYANHVYSTSVQAQRKRRYRQDPLYRLKDNVVTLIANAFANRAYSKNSRTQQILGCSYSDFCTHIESQFALDMSWDNRELWDLDHRVPVSLAENEQELMLLNHYTNFQPLWSGLNQAKKASVDREDPLYLELLALRNKR